LFKLKKIIRDELAKVSSKTCQTHAITHTCAITHTHTITHTKSHTQSHTHTCEALALHLNKQWYHCITRNNQQP